VIRGFSKPLRVWAPNLKMANNIAAGQAYATRTEVVSVEQVSVEPLRQQHGVRGPTDAREMLTKRKFIIDETVIVRPRFSRGFPETAGIIYDIANGKYEVRWPDGESGWFSSGDLQKVNGPPDDARGDQRSIAREASTAVYRSMRVAAPRPRRLPQ